MISFELDPLSTLEENLQRRLVEGDALRMQFEIVPLDHVVQNMLSPVLILSNHKLFIAYDEVVEEYDLQSLEMEILGEQPKFSIWQILFEGNLAYSNDKPDDLRKLKQSELLLRLTISEPHQVPKDYILRNGSFVAKAYQTWAFARLILNHKNRVTSDSALNDMLKGWFVLFNQKTVLTFAAATTIYFVMRWLLIPLLPAIFASIVDVLFGVFSLLMGAWVILSVNKNLERYQSIYLAYSSDSKISEPLQ